MIRQLKGFARDNWINFGGWQTDRKIIVLESDDWGTIRMSSKGSYNRLLDSGIAVNRCHYLQNDALASEEDLIRLLELLSRYKGSQGEYPVITANTIMTNPDFDKIKASNFTEYHYELFTETLARYPAHKNSFNLWEEGIRQRLFYPQFHGREHLQVNRWMQYLRNNNDSDTHKAFERGVFGLSTNVTTEDRKSYMAAYDWDNGDSYKAVFESILEGLALFEAVFGFKSLSFIAPNYTWHPTIEQALNDQGVRYLQGSTVQKSPNISTGEFNKIRHYTGQKNNLGQRYLVRNCTFEPSSNPEIDWVERCLKNIKTAFLWRKPAIIEVHRVNFIGFINPQNRNRNLDKLDLLLLKITQTWPEVEFMTSDQLGQTIEENE